MTENNPLLEIDGLGSPKEESNPLLQIDGLGETVPEVKKKEQTEPTQEVQVQETPTPVVSDVSEEPTPSPSVGQEPKKSSGYALDLSKITPEIISLEEDEAISFLEKNYSKLGFQFEKAGFGDAVRVKRTAMRKCSTLTHGHHQLKFLRLKE